MSLMSERRSIYNRRIPMAERQIIRQTQRASVTTTMPSRSNLVTRLTTIRSGRIPIRTRPGISIRTRPGIPIRSGRIPIRSGRIPIRSGRIPIRTKSGIPTRTRPSIPRGIIPTIIPTITPQPGGGLSTPTGGGLNLGLGDTIGDVKAFGGNIFEEFRALMPTAIKIVAAVIVFKIALWLLKGRGR